jgi:6-phosphogluconolactonase (cycloisomerase 2 family)
MKLFADSSVPFSRDREVTMKHLYMAFLLITALFCACTSEQDDGFISIEVYLDPEIRLQPMTMTPGIPLAATEYRVYGSGPVSSSFDLMIGGNSCIVEDILPGQWTIGAEGFNYEGTVLFSGETTASIDQDNSAITISMNEPDGEGTLLLSFSWEAALVSDAVITAALTSSNGTVTSLNPILENGTADTTLTLTAGLYEFTAVFFDGEERVAGAADYIKIMAGQETIGSIFFNVFLTPVSPEIFLESPHLAPLEVSIEGYDQPLFTGTPVILLGVTEPAVMPIFKWYVDGVLAVTGTEYTLDTSHTGTKRIDLLASSEGFASGGSTTLEISVYDPVYYGSLVFIESIFDNQEGADGLSGVRSLAVWGDFLYSAGYGEDEIGVYEIAEATGKLSFIEVVSAGSIPELGSIDAPSCLVSSGNLSDAGAPGLAAGCSESGALVLFRIDSESGLLSYLDVVAPTVGDFVIPAGGPPDIPFNANPLTGVSAIATAPDGGMIFASNIDGDTITSYTINDGIVTPYQIISQGTLAAVGYDGILLDGPEGIAISADGSFLAVTCRYSDSLLLFEINESGDHLTPIATFTDGLDGTDGLNGTAGVCFSPDDRFIYTTGYYDDAVSLFEKEQVIGNWLFVDVWKEGDFPGIAVHYPRGIAVSSDGTEVYVCAGGSDALTVFSRAVDTGVIGAPVSAVNGYDRNVGMDGIRRVVTAGEGDYVYAASSNDNAVALFGRE